METKGVVGLQTQFVTVKQAVNHTGLSEHYIRQQLQAGRIPHIMAGKKYLINLPLFKEMLETQSREGCANGQQ